MASEEDAEAWSDAEGSALQIPPSAMEDFERAQSKYPRNAKDTVEQTPAGPMISLAETPYFVPQWDEQLLGPAWRQRRAAWDFDNPPSPLPPGDDAMRHAFRYCADCALTWLVGHDGDAGHQHHPQHFAWQPEPAEIDVYRWGLEHEASLIVHLHGAVNNRGGRAGGPTGGLGLYFGPGSKYNMACPAGAPPAHGYDRERAGLEAAILAIPHLIYTILRDREAILKRDATGLTGAGGGNTRTTEAAGAADESDSSADESDSDSDVDEALLDLPFRLVFVMDDGALVDNLCRHQAGWTLKSRDSGGAGGQVLHDRQGRPVRNGDAYLRLEEALAGLEDRDVYVKWYRVPAEFNKEAAELARRGARGEFVGFGPG